MKLAELKSQVIRLVSGGIETDVTRYDFSDIEDKIHYGRSVVISESFKESKRIGSAWLQRFISPFNTNLQDSNKFVRFKVPDVIRLDNYRDGFVYVGAIDSNIAYRRVVDRATMANGNLYRITIQNQQTARFLYEQGYIEVYGNTNIRQLAIDGIFSNPTHIPTYNQDTDEYPLGETLIGPLKEYLLKDSLATEQQKLPNIINNGSENSQQKLAQ